MDTAPEARALRIRELGDAHEAHICAEMMVSTEPWITLGRTYDDALKIVSNPAKEVYVAVHEGTVAGFIILMMQGAFIGYIQTLCVGTEWRSRGIGSKLIAFAEERIFRETPNVFMCVSSFNTEAQRLYLRLGYEIVGELKDYIVAGYSEILLRKTIGPLSEFRKAH